MSNTYSKLFIIQIHFKFVGHTMLLRNITVTRRLLTHHKLFGSGSDLPRRSFSQGLETKYTDEQKQKILKVVNDPDVSVVSKYDLTKSRIKKITQWKDSNGQANSLTDIELIDGFNIKSATKLFDSILEGRLDKNEAKVNNKIKGQILHPNMSEGVRNSCASVLAVYVTVSSVCWSLIDRAGYEVTEWKYYGIDYPEGKKFHITDILDISWRLTQQLPPADVYVMKAEASTLRAAGSDPNNPKVIAVNLQKAQMVAMIVALLNAKRTDAAHESDVQEDDSSDSSKLQQKVYFLRPTLPFRLYGTLVGNERVSTDQTVERILQEVTERCTKGSRVFISDPLKAEFRSQKELQKDMLGHCLLLGLTFMDLCIYKNHARLNKLLNSG